MSESIRLSRDGRVAIVTLDRPERHNAFTQEMHARLGAMLDELEADRDVGAIVLAGEGKSFCSGMDVTMIGRRAEGDSDLAYLERLQRVRLRQVEGTKPIVAALKGAVLGLGCEVALACDIRIAAEDASFGLPELAMGLVTDSGGIPLLHALVGPARARYLLFGGGRIDAATALDWGLVEKLVPRGEAEAQALALAQAIAAKPPLAVAAARRILRDLDAAGLRAGMSAELFAQSALFATADHAEAKQAYRDKRGAAYRGC